MYILQIISIYESSLPIIASFLWTGSNKSQWITLVSIPFRYIFKFLFKKSSFASIFTVEALTFLILYILKYILTHSIPKSIMFTATINFLAFRRSNNYSLNHGLDQCNLIPNLSCALIQDAEHIVWMLKDRLLDNLEKFKLTIQNIRSTC